MITLRTLQHSSKNRIFYGESGEHPRLLIASSNRIHLLQNLLVEM
ncbi:hypothetical protein ISN44_As05g044090 [Arabidopsis suecica]|uniref:Uncharacterized protein n=1 Tax=Arabidopsis suecica TaxID=45249 RepID=A0A8T2DY55_ARASU|nr:hypothetical protein ISN44_As05g044090 [Arabidopsis suecica]